MCVCSFVMQGFILNAQVFFSIFYTVPIVVEYEFPEYTTSETIGFVELCAVVTSHPGGTPRPFVISATTADGSASTYACWF